MNAWRNPVVLVAASMLFAGCGSSRYVGADFRKSEAFEQAMRAHPDAGYIVEAGSSPRTLEEARLDAKSNIARRIDSQVESELTLIREVVNDDDQRQILSTVRETSRFEHAELVVMLADAETCDKTGCHVIGVLDRQKAIGALFPEYERNAHEFQLAVRTARPLESDPVRFTSAFRLAEELYRDLTPLRAQIAAIRGTGKVAGPDAMDEALSGLYAARLRVLSGLRITLSPDRIEPLAAWGALSAALAGAFASAGIQTTTGDACGQGFLVRVSASSSCDRGYAGPRCALTVTGVLRSCDGAEVQRFDLSGADLVGAHPRSEDAARNQALHHATAEALLPAIRDQLGGTWPIR